MGSNLYADAGGDELRLFNNTCPNCYGTRPPEVKKAEPGGDEQKIKEGKQPQQHDNSPVGRRELQ
jgi:hypothetical protein